MRIQLVGIVGLMTEVDVSCVQGATIKKVILFSILLFISLHAANSPLIQTRSSNRGGHVHHIDFRQWVDVFGT
jgi:hypothetical protein